MSFDPADPPDENLGRFQVRAVEMYEKLLNRGDVETAEELRSKDGASSQARFARQQCVEFDPKHDEDLHNTARIRVKNVYDILVELGHDDRAEELREFIGETGANAHAITLADEVDAEIDPLTGEFERPDGAEETDDAPTSEEALADR